MTAPVLSVSSPIDGANDSFLNKTLTATFAAAIDTSTIDSNSVILMNMSTEYILETSISYNTATFTISVAPLGVLSENTVYILRFPGTDIALSSDYVLKDSASSDPIATSIEITFTTGTKTYIDDSSIDKDSTDYSLEGDLNLPVHVKALGDFAVSGSTPKPHAYDVSTALDGSNRVSIVFNKALSGDLCSTDWVTVDAYPMLDSDNYLAVGSTLSTGVIAPVTGVSCSGSTLYIWFSGEMPKNVGVEVTLDSLVTAADGSEFGNSNYSLSFTTDRYPSISGIHAIKRELSSISDELNNDYIAALLLCNTINLVERLSIDTDNITWTHLQWVTNKTIVDILDDQELEKAIVAGTRRQLGDLNVSIDLPQSEAARLSLKHARALKKLDTANKTMLGARGVALLYSSTKNITDVVDRLWHGVAGKLIDSRWSSYQSSVPSSNTVINRNAKVPPGQSWW